LEEEGIGDQLSELQQFSWKIFLWNKIEVFAMENRRVV
jgi:hypothetical protein